MKEKIKLPITPQELGRLGEEIALKFAQKDFPESKGWKVTRVPGKKGMDNRKGFDIKVIGDKEEKYIEVKTTTRKSGIPDAYINEFSEESLLFKPDYLYLITILSNKGDAKITRLPKEKVNNYGKHELKKIVKFNYLLKKAIGVAIDSGEFGSEEIGDIRDYLESLTKHKGAD